MKKKILLMTAVLSVMFIQAKDHVVVVRPEPNSTKGATEVKIEQQLDGDSIIIAPGNGVTGVQITVTSTLGTPVSQCFLSADDPIPMNMTTPNLPEGCVIEISDNNGVVYSDVE